MGISTSTREAGKFPRTKDGRPLVTNPNGTVTSDGKVALVTYNRWSSAGDPLDNMLGLQKWHERNLLHGIAIDPELYQAACGIAEGEDDTWRTLLDPIIWKAKDLAGGNLAANRGTFIHHIIETGRTYDEHLGITSDMQQAVLEGWKQFLVDSQLNIVHSEANVVCDEYRYAGTLDAIARTATGAYTVLDIKTGKTATSNKYAVQLLGYALSHPYDVDTGMRGDWGFTVDRQQAFIAHCDITRLVNKGETSWQLIPVDLSPAYEALELIDAVHQWRSTRPFAEPVSATPVVVPANASLSVREAAPAPTPASTEPQRRLEGAAPRQQLLQRMTTLTAEAKHLLRERWCWDRSATQLNDLEAAAAIRLCDDIARDLNLAFTNTETPHTPTPSSVTPHTPPPVWIAPDNGPETDQDTRDALRHHVERLPDHTRTWCRQTVNDAAAAGRPVGNGNTERSFELLRTITTAGTALHDLYDGDERVIAEIIQAVTGHRHPTIGMTVGSLNTIEARALTEHLEQLYESPSALRWDNDGNPYLAA